MIETPTLHLFCNGEDTVSAADVEDAWAVWCETSGEKREDYVDSMQWEQIADDKPYTIVTDPDDFPEFKDSPPSERYFGHVDATKLAREWAAQGRGPLASTNW